MNKIVKSVFIITLFNVLTRLFSLLIKIYISRKISVEALGFYQIALSVFFLFLTIVTTGIPLVLSRKIADDKTKQSSLVSSSTFLLFILGFLVCGFIFVFPNFFTYIWGQSYSLSVLFWLTPAIFFSAISSGYRGALWGNRQYFTMGLSDLIEQIARFISLAILFTTSINTISGENIAGITLSISCVVSSIYFIVAYYSTGGKTNLNLKYIKPILKESAPIATMRTLSSIVAVAVSIIIPSRLVYSGLESSEAIGIFGIMTGMALPLLTIPGTLIGSIAVAIIPELSEKNKISTKNKINTVLSTSIIISCVLIPIFFALGEPIGIWLFKNELAGKIIKYGSLTLLPLGLAQISTSILNALGKETKTLQNYLISAIFMIVAIYTLPQYIGIYSYILGIGVMNLANTILNFINLKNYLSTSSLKSLAINIGIIIPITLLTYFTFNICTKVFDIFISLILSGGLSIICLALTLYATNQININYIFAKSSKKLKPAKT